MTIAPVESRRGAEIVASGHSAASSSSSGSKYQTIVSHTFSFEDIDAALEAASTPGATDKVVVTF
ncbi:hypothetical protein AU186_14670 [Mycobacterium sp. GA-1999]|nr:hypothetical protein AU186_14670 [Mycobacterium sp. GA-1999]KUH84058.1 hypothetical protein AU187_08425 [Mycobacterium sp. IS-1556]KUH89923.1 hypothetical protein AU185_07160 [Mycobacterium sp. GA-0227b]